MSTKIHARGAAQRGALLAIGTAVASSAGLLAPYVMGSVIESATTPLDGFNNGFFICGVIMVVGGAIAMALANPERDAKLVAAAATARRVFLKGDHRFRLKDDVRGRSRHVLGWAVNIRLPPN